MKKIEIDFPFPQKFDLIKLEEYRKEHLVQKKKMKEKDNFSTGLEIPILYKEANLWFEKNKKSSENIIGQCVSYISTCSTFMSAFLVCSVSGDIYTKPHDKLLSSLNIYSFNEKLPLNLYEVDKTQINLITLVILNDNRWVVAVVDIKNARGWVVDLGVSDKLGP